MRDVAGEGLGATAVKLTLRLTDDEQGPYPVATESLWCLPEGAHFRVRNIPFFKEALSFDDLIAVSPVSEDPGTFDLTQVIEESGHSTIWVLVQQAEAGRQVLDRLVALGCGREGGVFDGLFALNVPPTLPLQSVLDALEAAEAAGVLAADYPSIRQ